MSTKTKAELPAKLEVYHARLIQVVDGVDTVEIIDSDPARQNWVAQVIGEETAAELVRRYNAFPGLLSACQDALEVMNCIPYEQMVAVGGISRILREAIKEGKGEMNDKQ